MDVARSSVRLGADKVAVAYRRRKADMTALPEEVESAMAEGVEIMELYAPERIEADEDGQVKTLWVSQQMPGEIRGGRPSPKAIGTDSISVECDIVIAAVGQGIESRYFVDRVSTQNGASSRQPDGPPFRICRVFSPEATVQPDRQP